MASIIEKFIGPEITDEMISQAADLFSSNYGIWGIIAAERSGVKQGSRVKMSPKRLKHLILPPSSHAQHIYIRALLPTSHSRIAHVFATRFRCGDRSVLWITQLCVHASNRNQGIAKALLQALPHEEGQIVGILSSQPFAIAAVLRVFGSGVEIVENELEITGRMAREVMASCPVEYVRCAKLRGTLFPSDVNEGVVSCADTGFWVDHSEPKEALRILKEEKRVEWPLGELPEGCEFLILAKVREKDCTGARGDDYKVKM